MKNDLLQKYYGKYGDANNIRETNQTMNEGLVNKNLSINQRLSRSKDGNVSDIDHKNNISHQNFNSKGHMKTQSMLDKNPAF